MTKFKGSDWIMRLKDREDEEEEERRCLHCDRVLAKLNPNKYCFCHVHKYGRMSES